MGILWLALLHVLVSRASINLLFMFGGFDSFHIIWPGGHGTHGLTRFQSPAISHARPVLSTLARNGIIMVAMNKLKVKQEYKPLLKLK